MGREEILKALSARRRDMERFGVKSLALFGSAARDEAGPDSDVDVLVEFAGPGTFDAYMGLKEFLEDLLGLEVGLVTRKALRPRLRPRVESEAVYVL